MPASYRNGNRVMRWKKRHVISGILLFLLIWILASAWQIVSFGRKSELREADTAMTGGYGDGTVCSEARAAKEYAVSQGVPAEDIFVEEESRITQENMYYARLLMDEHGLKDALIVSDPLHMKRAMLMASDYGIPAYTSPTPTTRFVSLRTKLPFLARELFFYTGYRIYRIF